MEIIFKSIPVNWSIKKLKDISNIIMGQSPSSSTYNNSEKGLPFFQGKTEFGEIYPKIIKWCDKPIKLSYPNDILISVRAPVGDVNINNTDACIGRGLSAIRTIKNILNYKFLFYFLIMEKEKFFKYSQGSTFTAINSNDLNNFEILLPPLLEQNKISSILSTVDDLIENTTTLINSYSLLKKGLMQTLLTKGIGHTEFKDTKYGKIPLGWEIKSMEDIIKTLTDYVANGSFASLKENVAYKRKEDYAVLIRMQDYSNNFNGPFVYVDKHAYNIILSNVGAVGEIFKVPDLNKPMTLGPNAILFRSKEFDDYLYYWLKSAAGQNAIFSITSTTAQPKFNKTDFRKSLL